MGDSPDTSLKIALLMNKNNYVGREYLSGLKEADIRLDVISVGDYPEIDAEEEIRCGGRWTPEKMEAFEKDFNIIQFESLKDPLLISYLSDAKYDLCIQGGTGILRERHINKFRIGILNFHPGDLPEYRGSSAPEWQYLHDRPVICTCHLIDENIDTGPVYSKRLLETRMDDYYDFRSSIYPLISKFAAEVVSDISSHGGLLRDPEPQDDSKAVLRKYIGDETIDKIKLMF
jgi:methionyl-tRNA formyltransferase